MSRQHTETELWMSYGIIAGGGIGALMLGITGSALWIVFGPGVGLLVGLIVGNLRDLRSSGDPRR